MTNILIYTTKHCGFCLRAKALFRHKNLAFEEIPIDGDMQRRNEMMQMSGRRTVPQIWIDKRHIGGCSELMSLETSGQLDQLLASGR